MSRHSSAHWLSMEGILGYNKARPRFLSFDFFFPPRHLFFHYSFSFTCYLLISIEVPIVFHLLL